MSTKLKEELRETRLKVDELENKLEIICREKNECQQNISILNKTIKHLRENAYNCIDLSEYQIIKDSLEEVNNRLASCLQQNESLNKRLQTDANELDLIHAQNTKLYHEIKKLKRKESQHEMIIHELNKELIASKESCEKYRIELEKTLAQLAECNQMISICREEHLKLDAFNESGISIDDPNHCLNSSPLSDCERGESLDIIHYIKLKEMESVLEKKNAEINSMKEMNDRMEQEMTRQSFHYNKIIEDLTQAESALKEELKKVESDNKTLQNMLQDYYHEMEMLKNMLADERNKCDAFFVGYQSSEQHNNILRTSFDSLQGCMMEKTEEAMNAHESMTDYYTETNKSEKKVMKSNNQIISLMKEKERLLAEIKTMKEMSLLRFAWFRFKNFCCNIPLISPLLSFGYRTLMPSSIPKLKIW